jgi:hypothetical protein
MSQRILVVEDKEDNRRILRDLLSTARDWRAVSRSPPMVWVGWLRAPAVTQTFQTRDFLPRSGELIGQLRITLKKQLNGSAWSLPIIPNVCFRHWRRRCLFLSWATENQPYHRPGHTEETNKKDGQAKNERHPSEDVC